MFLGIYRSDGDGGGSAEVGPDLLRLADQLTQGPEQAATGRAVIQGPPNGRAGADGKL